MGPKGNSMKRLQEDTMCKMAVLGRGSMKDRKKVIEINIKRFSNAFIYIFFYIKRKKN